MHIPSYHAEKDLTTLYNFIRQNPLGLITTAIPHPKIPTIQTSHVPFILDLPSTPDPNSTPPKLGILRAHMARANPQCRAMIDSLPSPSSSSSMSDIETTTLENEILILFNNPIHSYVTPKFYKSTKPETGKVVPTWNYCAVQVYGKCKIYYSTIDPTTDIFLSKQLDDLSKFQEKIMADKIAFGKGGLEGSEGVWEITDAPDSYVGLLKKAIIGVEITIERVEGRFKMGQEKVEGDWLGLIEGFQDLKTAEGVSMAEMTREVGIRAGKCPVKE